MKNRSKNFVVNLIFPALIFGSLTGALTALTVLVYKVCAKYVISASETGYHYLREHIYFVPVILVALLGVSFLFVLIYKKTPNIRGGGIPTSIGVLRGIITFRWLRNLLGVFFMSLTAFLTGVPLGNEGPSVQMGTAIGRGSVYTLAKKHKAWDRYSMTGGACAGFSVATGAPISGIMFAVEEAHQRISPMIVIVACVSVMFAQLVNELLAPLLGVSTDLFPELQLRALSPTEIWIPLIIGVALGVFSVLFLKYYQLLYKLWNGLLSRIPQSVRIFLVFTVTLIMGVVSFSFISTGHELILSLFSPDVAPYMLLLIVFVRSTLTLSANSTGITGGVFLPTLAIGAAMSSLVGKLMQTAFGLSDEYYVLILVLGIVASISGMMKMPLTSIVFAVEALSFHQNVLYVIAVSGVAYIISEILGTKSINDSILEKRIEEIDENSPVKVFDTFVTVQENAFAIGKQIRDIFWPPNLFVLSIQHASRNAEVDEHGGKDIREGDVLHVRYSTHDERQTKEELEAIVGEQDYSEKEAEII